VELMTTNTMTVMMTSNDDVDVSGVTTAMTLAQLLYPHHCNSTSTDLSHHQITPFYQQQQQQQQLSNSGVNSEPVLHQLTTANSLKS